MLQSGLIEVMNSQICRRCESASNITADSELQLVKHDGYRISIAAGTQLDCSNEQPESASASIRVKFEQHSNVNDESVAHPESYFDLRISTNAALQIDLRAQHFTRKCFLLPLANVRAMIRWDTPQ
jgi:hypothetical protein